MQYQRQQKFVIQTETMVPGGVAMSHLPDGRPVFVKDAAPDEQLEIALTRIKPDFAEGAITQILRPSAGRVTSPFPPEARAGANWAFLDYSAQLAAKETILRETLRRIGHLPLDTFQVSRGKCLFEPIVPSPNLWRYRNKVELSFGTDEEGQVTLGFHAPGRFDQIIPTDDIALFPEVGRDILDRVLRWARQERLPAFEPRRKTGLLRNLVLRRAEHGSDFALNLITSPGEIPHDSLLDALKSVPLSGILWSQNASAATIVRVDTLTTLAGSPRLTEQFLDVPIEYGIDSFFQVHTTMAEQLAVTLLERLQIQPGTQIIDGYAGVGGFGLFAALRGANVTSIESHPISSADAKKNAKRLGVAERMTFINLSMEDYLLSSDFQLDSYNAVLIVDPPRAGLHPKALKAILGFGLQRMVYVSCNPATLARDLDLLHDAYEPIFIQPFDLFPQTSHIETLVELCAKKR